MTNRNPQYLNESRSKYIKKHSTGDWFIETKGYSNISAVIVIPALSEYNNIRKLLESFLENDHTVFNSVLILFVVNNLASANDDIKNDNTKTLQLLKQINIGISGQDNLVNKIISAELRIGFVDASSEGKELPEKDGGVGLARKTGMDLALSLFEFGTDSNKLIVCLDSDCTIPANYLTEICKLTHDFSFEAGYVNYEHPLDDVATIEAIICYEVFLFYYVLSLKYAGSPYAFHTIGSTMLCNADAYIKTGGMNKKKAAEDFYFLEKMSKNFEIRKIDTTSVYPSPRVSFRVPFGTGQRVGRYLSHVQNEYLLYSPKSFTVLKEWLAVFNGKNILTTEEYLQAAKNINNALSDFLQMNNFETEWTRILKNSKQPEQIHKQKKIWFDGFRTLKFIHYLRDNGYPLQPMFHALDEIFAMTGVGHNIKRESEIPDVETQKQYLKLLRSLS